MAEPLHLKFRSWAMVYRGKVQRAMKQASEAVAADVRESISTPYPPPSDPGLPPHLRTGQLAKGVRAEPTHKTLTKISVRVVSRRQPAAGEKGRKRDPEYVPQALEYGTARMSPRPYMRPAMMRWASKFKPLVKQIMRDL